LAPSGAPSPMRVWLLAFSRRCLESKKGQLPEELAGVLL
jgi:hypothetical protein